MRQVYQPTKSPDHGVNSCESCFLKQLVIDRLTQENESLRGELRRLKRKAVEGFFSSLTPSSKLPVKVTSTEVKSKKRGGAQPGHQGHGRRAHSPEEAEEVRVVKVAQTSCPKGDATLWQRGSVQRSVLDVDAMQVRKLLVAGIVCNQDNTFFPTGKVVSSLLPKMLLSNELLSEVVESHYLKKGRQYFPKGSDFSKITEADIERAIARLNNRPRKGLSYRTPQQVFFKEQKIALTS